MATYRIEAGTGQHLGDRGEQQDRVGLFAAPRAPGYMMAVLADGMGGAGGGSKAAEQAMHTAQQIFSEFSPATDDIRAVLLTIVDEVHTIVNLMTLASRMRPQTTLVVLVLTPSHEAIWAHVGDSRLYRFEGPNLAERTADHTAAAAGVEENVSRPDTAGSERSVLLNVLGNERQPPVPTLGRYAELKAGDAFLLCSDGLWAHLMDTEYGPAIAMNTPRNAAQLLIRKARERAVKGDGDNCTVGIIKLVKPPVEVIPYQVQKLQRAV
ncbi:MAG: protein phosphatase 2C domain-containing protein [Burkholderiaceae bacterium]